MKEHYFDWAAVALAILISIFYWTGISSVPFHPDESTYIFMSSDFDQFFHQPFSLAWKPENGADLRQHYRLVDAPLVRDLIGLGRFITNSPALVADWNWLLTWDQNSTAGALPSNNLLQTARFSLAWLFPFSLFFIYLIGKKLGGSGLGFLAMLLLAINPLVLLHTRRAMAESVLLFTVIFSIWCLLSFQKRPWLIAIPVALAFAAKQSSAGLILTGLCIPIFQWFQTREKSRAIKNIALFLVLFLGITVLLNPFLWADPIRALGAAVAARQDLLQQQLAAYTHFIPGQVLGSLPERGLGVISNLFFTPLQFAETGNYLVQTQPVVSAYLVNPMANLLRSFVGGGILFFISLVGFILAIVTFRKGSPTFRWNMGILILATFALVVGLVLVIPLAFQRYVMPVIPVTTIWSAFALDQLIGRPLVKRLKSLQKSRFKAHFPRLEG